MLTDPVVRDKIGASPERVRGIGASSCYDVCFPNLTVHNTLQSLNDFADDDCVAPPPMNCRSGVCV